MSERLLQALRRGGCAAPSQGHWGIWRGRDRRGTCIGHLSSAAMESLQLAGDVGPLGAEGEVLVWTGTQAADERARQVLTPEADPRARGLRRSPLQIVLSAIEDPADRALAKAAALRLRGDLEQAASGQRVTQNWDPSLQVDGVSGNHSGGRMADAVRASRRLGQLEGALGRADMNLLYQLIIQERSLASFCDGLALSPKKVPRALARRLIALATAYNLRVARA